MDINIDGYTTIRSNGDKEKTEKGRGGGLCMFVKDDWATQGKIRDMINTPSYEILTVCFTPHYLPREFGQVTIILVYVPGPNVKEAAEPITESYNTALSRSTDQAVFVCGDFDTCDQINVLPNVH
jgi:hypothetical protein